MDRMLYELSVFSYFNAPFVGQSVADCLEQICNDEKMRKSYENNFVYLPNLEILKQMNRQIYSHVYIKKYVNDNKKSGVVYYLFSVGKMLVMAIRGSEVFDDIANENDWADWKDNFMLFNEQVSNQQLFIHQAISKLNIKQEFIICGHSKGGNLALFAYISMAEEYRRYVKRVVGFNACGLQKKVLNTYLPHFEKTELESVITLYENENDLVSCFFEHVVSPIYVQSLLPCNNGILLLHNHNMYSMSIEGADFLVAKKKSPIILLMHFIIATLVMNGSQKRTNLLLQQMEPYFDSQLSLRQMYQVIIFQIGKYSDIFDDIAPDEILTTDFLKLLKKHKHLYLRQRIRVSSELDPVNKKILTKMLGDIYAKMNQGIGKKLDQLLNDSISYCQNLIKK